MSKSSLTQMSVDDLLLRHAELSSQAGQAEESFERMSKVNRLLSQVFDINAELKSRGQQIALRNLFSNPDPWVRLNAARIILDIVPVEARAVIQTIADSKNYPVAADAGMCLSLFDGPLADLRVR